MSTSSSIMPHFPEMWFEHNILDLHNLWPFSIADEIINIIALIHFYYFFWKKPDISMHPQNPQKNLSYHFGIKEIFTESETVEAQKPTKHTHTDTPTMRQAFIMKTTAQLELHNTLRWNHQRFCFCFAPDIIRKATNLGWEFLWRGVWQLIS